MTPPADARGEPAAAGHPGGAQPPGTGRHVLVTGSHRSGSTWVGTMLGLADGVVALPKEPFNPNPHDYGLDGLATHWFEYAPALPQEAARRAYRRVLDGRCLRVLRRRGPWGPALSYLAPWSHPRVVVHDPIAAFSSEWLAHNFDMAVVVLVRHPAAFAASLLRMDWEFDFSNLTDQQRLVADHLEPLAAQLRAPPSDPVERAGLLWTCIYTALLRFADRNPGWAVVTHEALSTHPLERFRDLYRHLGLEWSRAVEAGIRGHTATGNPVRAPDGVAHQLRRDSAASIHAWRSDLSADQVRAVRRSAGDLADRFYGEGDWELTS